MSDKYKGVSFPFRFNTTGGVATSKLSVDDFSRIEDSLKQIVFTFKKERIMNLEFGNTREFIFENIEDLTSRNLMAHELSKLITKEEPRVSINNINVDPDSEVSGRINVTIDLIVTKFVTNRTVNVILDIPEELTGGVIDIG